MKENLIKKLASRKFWMALGALICAFCVLLGVDEMTVEKLAATVSSLGVLATYILTEGYIDAKRIKQSEREE